jgi:hypothetical protein
MLSAQKNTATPVTATVYDCAGPCSGANQLLTRSDHFNGTDFATYVTSSNRHTGNLSSSIGSDGFWKLYLGAQSQRTLYLTPNQPVGEQPPGPLPGYYWQDVTVYSSCRDQNNNVVPFPSLVNGSDRCSLAVNFQYNGLLHKLVMSSVLPGPGPETGLASVTCNAVSGGVCVDWTLAPNAAAPKVNVASLYYYLSKKGTATWVLVGQYYNSFLIRLTNP